MAELDPRSTPSLSSLRAFEAAARLGGFTAAARVLNVTHAAVAQQVRGLEAELGTTLLRRDGRGVALTPEGERLSTALREGFGIIAKGIADLRGGERRKGIRVTATVALTQTVLMPRLGEFWSLHPDIAVSLTPTQRVVDLEREGVDIAIRTGNGRWPGMRVEFLCRTRMMVVGAPKLLEKSRDLSQLPWFLDADDGLETEWLARGGLDRDRLRVHEMDNPMLAVTAATAGLGLLFASNIVARDAIAEGRLVEVDFPPLSESRYWIVLPQGPVRPAVRIFVDWIRTALGDGDAEAAMPDDGPSFR